MKKKALSLLLALVLCLGLAVVPASAAGNSWPIKQLELGILGAFVVTDDNSLYTWGDYDDSGWDFLGIKGNVYSSLWPNGSYNSATKVMDGVAAVAASKIGCLERYLPTLPNLMILKTDGSLWVWGENLHGQLGQGTREQTTRRTDFSPVKVMDNVKAMDCSGNLCAAITNDGDLYCWGYVLGRLDGAMGTRTRFHYLETPTKVLSNVTAVSCGETHTLALTADGTVYGMGDHSNWKLGDGTDRGEPALEMTRIMGGCTSVVASRFFSLALRSDGTVYAWGRNASGVFGVSSNDVDHYAAPTAIMKNVKQIAADDNNIAFVKTDNSLWVTGDNRFGIQGQGCTLYEGEDAVVYPRGPVQVDTNVQTVDVYLYAMLYVKTNGVMYGTGSSVEGVPNYTYQKSDGGFRVTTSKNDPSGAVCSPTLAGTSLTPYTGAKPSTPQQPAVPTAYASTQTVIVDGKEVEFQMYALKDANGNLTNYIKLRDVATVLNGARAQFEVGWNGSINLETGKPYTPNGSEMIKNFEGDQPYKKCTSPVNVNGAPADLEAITLTDAKGGAYNYFKLRDLGRALGFNVSWINGRVVIASNEPYSDAQ